MHDASRRCPALKLFVSNIFFSLTGGETFSMCFWSDMEGERLESFLNIIYQYTISYQNLNLKIYGRILNIIGMKIETLILRQLLNKCLYFYSLNISELSFTVQCSDTPMRCLCSRQLCNSATSNSLDWSSTATVVSILSLLFL